MYQKHPFHRVDPSPWPRIASTAALGITTGTVLAFHNYSSSTLMIISSRCMRRYTIFFWWKDIVRESTIEGQHTTLVQLGLRIGIRLFIVSEVIFFIAFFWSFFWSALAPTPEIGSVWPPHGIDVLNAWEVPFLNTRILLSSGAAVTWSHHGIVEGSRNDGLKGRLLTVVLAARFTLLQRFEYINAKFTISDSVYGSCFYMATGFHGFHVFIGTCFLSICRIRLINHHFTKQHHFGFEAAAWYWHFVDVVWLFLFVVIYWWGN